jgi:F-type H+-transporting ATPase subunit delta
MGVLANHVPSIEQLKPGLIEVIEESGGSKQFFCTATYTSGTMALYTNGV